MSKFKTDPATSGESRNKPCPCGSGYKAKRCCIARRDISVGLRLREVRKGRKEKPGTLALLGLLFASSEASSED